jgi:hypothetical protein
MKRHNIKNNNVKNNNVKTHNIMRLTINMEIQKLR